MTITRFLAIVVPLSAGLSYVAPQRSARELARKWEEGSTPVGVSAATVTGDSVVFSVESVGQLLDAQASSERVSNDRTLSF